MPADFVCVLECQTGTKDGVPYRLAKTVKPDGTIQDWNGSWLVRPEHIPVESLSDLHALLECLAADPMRCVIRDRFIEEGALAEWVPRRADPNKYEHAPDFEPASHHWVCVDLDASVIALDPKDPRASVEAWRATLPPALACAGMVFHLSAKAHLFPYLRGHAWFWCTRPVEGETLKAWYSLHDWDPTLADAIHVHYTADPVWEDGVDPYAGRRIHVFEGPDADIQWDAIDVEAGRRAPAVDPRSAPDVPADASVLEVLGPCANHEGAIWSVCGALGGVWRRLGWDAPRALATIKEWLAGAPNPADVPKCVVRCMGAWELAPDQCTGRKDLVKYLGGDEAWADRVTSASSLRRRKREAAAREAGTDTFEPVPTALVGDPDSPPLLSAPKNTMYIRDDFGYFGPVPLGLMQPTLQAIGLQYELGCDQNGKILRDEHLYRSGAPILEIVRSFEETGSRYEAEEFKLHQGYRLPEIIPVENARVAAWLEALAGEMITNLLDWIVLCSQENISRRAAALVIIGEHSTGKSLVFKCLARMWGALNFVALKDAAAQFNSSVADCPIVVDDECQALKSRLVSSEDFRERVQARSRKYEPKGLEKVTLLGYTREGIAANASDEVTIARVHSASTREAVEKRLCVVHVRNTAQARKTLLAIADGDQDAEVAAIMGHLSWLWKTRKVESLERFAASGGAGVHTVALAGVADEGAELWDHLHVFLMGDNVTAVPETTRPWVVRTGELLAYPQAIAQSLALHGGHWDARRVGRLLGAIAVETRVQVKIAGRPVRYWSLDWDRALELAGLSREDRANLLARI